MKTQMELEHQFVGAFDLFFACPHCGQNLVILDPTNLDFEYYGGLTFNCDCRKTKGAVSISTNFIVEADGIPQ